MRSSETRIAGKLSVSRALLSDSLHEKSSEGNLANLIFQAISIIPGIFCRVWSFSALLGRLQVVLGAGARSKEVSGSQRKTRAPEWWPESSTFGWPGFGHIRFGKIDNFPV